MTLEEKITLTTSTPTPSDLEAERLRDGVHVLVNAMLPEGATDSAFYRMERAAVQYAIALWDAGADGFASHITPREFAEWRDAKECWERVKTFGALARDLLGQGETGDQDDD